MTLELLGLTRGLADADEEDTRGKRVQCPCVSNLEVLLVEMPAGAILQLPDDIGGSPSVRLVHRNDNALRIVVNTIGEHYVEMSVVQYH